MSIMKPREKNYIYLSGGWKTFKNKHEKKQDLSEEPLEKTDLMMKKEPELIICSSLPGVTSAASWVRLASKGFPERLSSSHLSSSLRSFNPVAFLFERRSKSFSPTSSSCRSPIWLSPCRQEWLPWYNLLLTPF